MVRVVATDVEYRNLCIFRPIKFRLAAPTIGEY